MATAGQLPGAPGTVVAHRTSPTNMGLALLANLTAYDFGYIPAGQLIVRTANAMAHDGDDGTPRGALLQLVRHAVPATAAALYVSSVDSGNLAGHLLTLRAGLVALADDRIMDPRWFEGLSDTLRALLDAIGDSAPAPLAATAKRAGNRVRLTARDDRSGAPVARSTRCEHCRGRRPCCRRRSGSDTSFWADALVRQCASLRDEAALLASWTTLDAREIPTLRQLAALEAQRPPAVVSGGAAERIAEIERLVLQCDQLARMKYDFLYDRARHLLAIGYNVTESTARPEFLRSARIGSALLQLRRDLAGTAPAGKLVRARAAPHDRGKSIGPHVVERFDVRVPDAAARNAHVTTTRCSTGPIA